MGGEFFNSGGGDHSLWLQHLIWFLGHPEVWFMLLCWAVFLVAMTRTAGMLRHSDRRLGFKLFVIALGLGAAGYISLVFQAFGLFLERGNDLARVILSYANLAMVLVALFSIGQLLIRLIKKQEEK